MVVSTQKWELDFGFPIMKVSLVSGEFDLKLKIWDISLQYKPQMSEKKNSLNQ